MCDTKHISCGRFLPCEQNLKQMSSQWLMCPKRYHLIYYQIYMLKFML